MGSRVKETKSETATAKVTVMPNWKKNRPMTPFMKATGTNTAMMERLVASTARPISEVPFRAAVMWSWPCSRCRTMFSRTTMASSMRRPMASDSAMSVITLSVMPRKYMAMNEEMTEMGRVRPVMTVERQELRKQKTISTVSSPPSRSVLVTSWTESRIMMDPSRTIWISTEGGSSVRSLAISLLTASTTPTVLDLDCLKTSRTTAGTPSMSASVRCSSTPSRTSATWPRVTGTPARWLTTMEPKPETSRGFPAMRTGQLRTAPVDPAQRRVDVLAGRARPPPRRPPARAPPAREGSRSTDTSRLDCRPPASPCPRRAGSRAGASPAGPPGWSARAG